VVPGVSHCAMVVLTQTRTMFFTTVLIDALVTYSRQHWV